MATFTQNMKNIRGEAVYGQQMRASIAEGIEQAQGLPEIQQLDARILAAERRIIQSAVILEAKKITETYDDYKLVVS